MIALCGFSLVGKDETALAMPDYKRFAFADQIKADVQPLLARVGLHLSNPAHKKLARPLLEAWGDLACWNNPQHWIDYLPTDGEIVVTDLRRVIEAQAVFERGGMIVRLHREGIGPASEWERKLIAEIDAEFPDLPHVWNDSTPEECATMVMMHEIAFQLTARDPHIARDKPW